MEYKEDQQKTSTIIQLLEMKNLSQKREKIIKEEPVIQIDPEQAKFTEELENPANILDYICCLYLFPKCISRPFYSLFSELDIRKIRKKNNPLVLPCIAMILVTGLGLTVALLFHFKAIYVLIPFAFTLLSVSPCIICGLPYPFEVSTSGSYAFLSTTFSDNTAYRDISNFATSFICVSTFCSVITIAAAGLIDPIQSSLAFVSVFLIYTAVYLFLLIYNLPDSMIGMDDEVDF